MSSAFSKKTRIKLIGLIVALTAAKVAYLLIYRSGYGHTALMFVGLPAALAFAMCYVPKAKTLYGFVFQGITLSLLLSGIILLEGFICILMAAPIFYIVGMGVVAILKYVDKKNHITFKVLAFLPLALMSLEGVNDSLSFSRQETVEVTKTFTATPEQVRAALTQAPTFAPSLPLFLSLGFPRPVAAFGEGLQIGDQRKIDFTGERNFYGPGVPGSLVLEIVESESQRVKLKTVEDTSYISHWLAWQTIEMDWRSVGDERTEVKWVVRFERLLDPYWYFAPFERYAVKLSVDVIGESMAREL